MELTAWKAIAYDISQKMQKASAVQKGEIAPFVGDLNIMIGEMDERIEQIRESCTPDTGIDDIQVERDAYDQSLVNVRMKANEAMKVLGAGDFGG